VWVALPGQSPGAQPPPAPRSVWDGVYTEKQGQRGEAIYHEDCSSCHGDQLSGKSEEDIPALSGGRFHDTWNGRTVGDLYKKIVRTMPQDDPGRLDARQSTDVVAFILSFNKLPAGQAELPADDKILSEIRIEPEKK